MKLKFFSFLAFLAVLAGCTPVARQEASAVISTVGPALCSTLSSIAGADGQIAGLVCADLSKALGAGLMFARAGAPAGPTLVSDTPAAPAACTQVNLITIDPTRDPREFLCAEAFGGEEEARRAFQRARRTGHAR